MRDAELVSSRRSGNVSGSYRVATHEHERSEALSPARREAPKEAIGSRGLGLRDGRRVCRPAELGEQLVGLGLLGKRGIEQRRRVVVAELLRP